MPRPQFVPQECHVHAVSLLLARYLPLVYSTPPTVMDHWVLEGQPWSRAEEAWIRYAAQDLGHAAHRTALRNLRGA